MAGAIEGIRGNLKARGAIALAESLTCSFMYGLKVVLVSITASTVGGFTLAWTSTAFGGAILGIYVFLIKKLYLPKKLSVKIWGFILLTGFLRSVSPVFQFMALERISSTTMNFVFNFVGIATIIASILINHEKPSLFQFIGTFIMLIGLQIYFPVRPTSNEFIGILLVVISIIFVGIMNSLSRELNKLITQWLKENPGEIISNLSVVTISIVIGGSLLLILGLLIDTPLPKFSTNDLIVFLYTGSFGLTFVAIVWYDLVGRWEAYKASLLSSISIFWTCLLSYIFLKQPVHSYQILGIVIMLIGLAIIGYRKSAKIVTLDANLTSV